MVKNPGMGSFEPTPALTPAERVCRTHLVEDMIDMQVMNIQNHFLRGRSESSQGRAKVGEVLENFAKEIAEKILAANDLVPIDAKNPKWKQEIGKRTHDFCETRLPEYFNNGGTLLAARLADEFGGNPEDWVNKKEMKAKLNIVALRTMQFVSAAAFCEKFGLDVNKIKSEE